MFHQSNYNYLNNISINITPLFNERKLGNTDNVKEEFWLTQLKEENAKTINGESRKEVTERMLKGINNILNTTKDNTQTVIITHATAMTFLPLFIELNKAPVPACDITTLASSMYF